MKPLAVDLCCGLGGWSEGLIAEGWDVVGFDNVRHHYGDAKYPGQLVLQDILTLDGRQFRGKVCLIVASPPCTEFSFMAMPWTRAKQIARALRGRDDFPDGYKGSRTISELTRLFDACVRIGREAECPIVIENVRGAQPWIGRAKYSFGSFYLWGDVPALMPSPKSVKEFMKVGDCGWRRDGHKPNVKYKGPSVSFNGPSSPIFAAEGRKGYMPGTGNLGKSIVSRQTSSGSLARKAASAHIAKIPFVLARWVAKVYYPIHEGYPNPQRPEIQSMGDCS